VGERTLATLALLAALATASCGPSGDGGRPAANRPDTIAAAAASAADSLLLTAEGVGHVRIGMTLDEVRAALPGVTFERISDGEGIALVRIARGVGPSITVYANEPDATKPIDGRSRIEFIQVSDPAFYTADGTRPGTLVADVVRRFGPVRRIFISEIEQREFLECEGQPDWLSLRIGPGAIYPGNENVTTQFAPDTKILSMAIARRVEP
jgi:hypothetical protein